MISPFTHSTPTRRLVVVRAGDDSLHRRWRAGSQAPTFDLAVSYYGDDPSAFGDAAIRHGAKGGKWDGLYAFLAARPDIWDRYDWIWLPDDDLDATASSINRLFDIVERYNLDVAQPALTWDSHFSFFETLENPACLLRYVNFVECMAPIFRSSYLRKICPAFAETRFGWGLDILWSRWMDEPDFKSAIVDAVSVRHTKPVGKGSLNTSSEDGPAREQDMLLSKYRQHRLKFVNYAAITRDGMEITSRLRLCSILFRGWKPFLQAQFDHPECFRPEGAFKLRRVLRLVVKSCLRRLDLTPLAFRPEFHRNR